LLRSGEDIIIRNYIVLNNVDVIKRMQINRLGWAEHVTRRENEEVIK
jgi:hypothetical protein